MPKNDDNFSIRWSMIKRRFTRQWLSQHQPNVQRTPRMQHKRESGVWQRRFGEHLIRDQDDMANRMDYVHYNPIKHGVVECPHQWPYSTFHRWIKEGAYRKDWLCSCKAKHAVQPLFVDDIGNVGE